jgi:hypothetical protein
LKVKTVTSKFKKRKCLRRSALAKLKGSCGVRWLFSLLRAHAQILNSQSSCSPLRPSRFFCLLLRAARSPLIFALYKNATAGSTQECCGCRFSLTTCALLTTQLLGKRSCQNKTHFSEYLTSNNNAHTNFTARRVGVYTQIHRSHFC